MPSYTDISIDDIMIIIENDFSKTVYILYVHDELIIIINTCLIFSDVCHNSSMI